MACPPDLVRATLPRVRGLHPRTGTGQGDTPSVRALLHQPRTTARRPSGLRRSSESPTADLPGRQRFPPNPGTDPDWCYLYHPKRGRAARRSSSRHSTARHASRGGASHLRSELDRSRSSGGRRSCRSFALSRSRPPMDRPSLHGVDNSRHARDLGEGKVKPSLIGSSEMERDLASVAGTLGEDETLSEQRVRTWSVMWMGTAATASSQPWLADALSELRSLALLETGWDSYGGDPIAPVVADRVARLLRVLAREPYPRPSLVPTTSGGVQLEWYGSVAELSLEVESPIREVTLFYRDLSTDATWEGPLGDEPVPLEKVLWQLSNEG